jgi:8-oxo-dGTP pyrophosphatase MutT (NUDIX family)
MPKGSSTIDITNNTITTAGAVIFRDMNNEKQFLLVQENDGQYGLAGGAKDIEDKDIVATLQRELEEELSLSPIDYKFEKTDTSIEFVYGHRSSTRFGKKGVTVYFLVEVFNPEKIKASSELKDTLWASGGEAIEKLAFEEVKNGFREVINNLSK